MDPSGYGISTLKVRCSQSISNSGQLCNAMESWIQLHSSFDDKHAICVYSLIISELIFAMGFTGKNRPKDFNTCQRQIEIVVSYLQSKLADEVETEDGDEVHARSEMLELFDKSVEWEPNVPFPFPS
jgi:hypothetical protein